MGVAMDLRRQEFAPFVELTVELEESLSIDGDK